MKYKISIQDNPNRLVNDMKKRNGVDLSKCYQCGECTAGCPLTPEMDAGPTKTLRYIQLGMEKELFSLNTPWLCSSCETCTTRCPNDIDIALVMDTLRQMARILMKRIPIKNTRVFQDAFLNSMRKFGQLYEFGMVGEYNLKSGNIFHDAKLGPAMIMKGKLPLLPHVSKNRERLQKIFERAEELEKKQDTISSKNEDGHGEVE